MKMPRALVVAEEMEAFCEGGSHGSEASPIKVDASTIGRSLPVTALPKVLLREKFDGNNRLDIRTE